jgi:hypothetical protein
MANQADVIPMGRLAESATRIKAAMRAGDTGYAMIAHEVVSIEQRWDILKGEAEGRSIHRWIKEEIGTKDLAWWRRLASGVTRLSRHVAAHFSTQAIFWLTQSVPERYLDEVRDASLALQRREKQPSPVTLAQAKRMGKTILPAHPKVDGCADCEALRAQVREMGGEPRV